MLPPSFLRYLFHSMFHVYVFLLLAALTVYDFSELFGRSSVLLCREMNLGFHMLRRESPDDALWRKLADTFCRNGVKCRKQL